MTLFLHIISSFDALIELNQNPVGMILKDDPNPLSLELDINPEDNIVLHAVPMHAQGGSHTLLPYAGVLRLKGTNLVSSNPLIQITQYPDDNYEILLKENILFNYSLPQPITQYNFQMKNTPQTATIFFDGIYQFIIETQKDILFKHNIREKIEDAKIEKIKNTDLILVQAEAPNNNLYVLLLGYNEGNYHILLEALVNQIEQDGQVLTTLSHAKDIAGHGIVKEYSLKNNNLEQSTSYLVYLKEKPKLAPIPAIVPFAFLEAVGLKNFTLARSYLTPELSNSCQDEHLEDYFGNFIEVLPAKYERNPSGRVALIYRSETLYAKIFEVELKFNKISDFNAC